MNIMNEDEVRLSFEQLEELVTLMKNEGAKSTDAVYLTNLGRVGNFATLGIRDEYGFSDAMYFRVRGNKSRPYKCHDCRKCVYSEKEGFSIMCLNGVDEGYDPVNVGICNEELLEACNNYAEVTYE